MKYLDCILNEKKGGEVMLLHDILEVGDRVVFSVDRERRRQTNDFDGIPDGTEATVCGFYNAIMYEPRYNVLTKDPGVYHTKGAVYLLLRDGRSINGGNCDIEMIDTEEQKRRDAAARDSNGCFVGSRYTHLGDLPETRFWETDKVRVNLPDGEVQEMFIQGIDYHFMHKTCNDGSPFPFYRVEPKPNSYLNNVKDSWMELIERGPVWKYYHGEPVEFSSAKEEAEFLVTIGKTKEVRNPASNLYDWNKEEALEALKDGIIHYFAVHHGHVSVRRFKDDVLGEKIAKAFLEEFKTA